MRSDIARCVGEQDIGPRLPSVPEFAELIGRPAHSELTQSLYRMVLSAHVELAGKLPGAMPKSGAHIDLPVLAPAPRRPAHWAPDPHAEVSE